MLIHDHNILFQNIFKINRKKIKGMKEKNSSSSERKSFSFFSNILEKKVKAPKVNY